MSLKNKSGFLFITMLLSADIIHSQISNTVRCDTLILDEHSKNVLGINQRYLNEYLIQIKKVDPINISNITELKRLRTMYRDDNCIIFYDTVSFGRTISIEIRRAYQKITPNDYLMPNNYNSMLFYDLNNSPYGFIPTDTIASYISTFRIRYNSTNIQIPEEIFDDLLFPNFLNTYYPIEPIFAYYSGKENKM